MQKIDPYFIFKLKRIDTKKKDCVKITYGKKNFFVPKLGPIEDKIIIALKNAFIIDYKLIEEDALRMALEYFHKLSYPDFMHLSSLVKL